MMMIGKLRKKLRAFLSLRSEPSLSHTLSQRTIYIVPDAQGLSFLFMLLVMLVTAINYQSSLIYLLLFSLGALFFPVYLAKLFESPRFENYSACRASL
jgi:hypothetical protein